MLRDVYWRQYPIDLLNDDKMTYIESLMPEEYKYAPYMFYIAALKLADDNGIFDLGDGIIFARLMRVKSRALVFQIANYMRQQNILYRLSDDTTLMQIADWSYSDKKSRTAEERRRIVAEKIAQERAKKANYSQANFSEEGCAGKHNAVPQSESCAGKCNAIPQTTTETPAAPELAASAPQTAPEAETAAPRRDFLCPDDDKNAKNVVTLQTDNTDNTIQRVQTTHTHTETQQAGAAGAFVSPALPACQKTQTAVAEKQNEQTQKPTEMQTPNDSTCDQQSDDLAAMALQAARGKDEENADSELFAYLEDFFVKNCYGFEKKKATASLNQLCEKIKSVSDEINPPVEVAGVLCSEFKKMCDGQRSDYWKGQALLPAFMIKTRCWMELMQYAGKILASTSASNKFTQSWEQAAAEYEAEKSQISVAVREEYLKYKIDPDAPDANFQLIRAKSAEQEELRKAKEIEEEAIARTHAEVSEQGFDIF